MKAKNPTGERLETRLLSNVAIEHLHRYALAVPLCSGKIVLDIACGEGYGSNLLAGNAISVIGVDIAGDIIIDAREKYTRKNLSFLQGSTSAIPLPDDSVDVVVSFETIEHHAEHEHMMREIKRVLKPAGQLIISSPDKKYYSDEANYQNPYHIKELYIEDFKNLIKNFFTHYDFYSQKSAQGSLIISENDKNSFTEYSGTFEGVNEIRDYKPVYHICLASDKDIPKLENSFFLDELIQLGTVWREGIDLVKQSLSYRLGNFLLSPFSLLKRLWSR